MDRSNNSHTDPNSIQNIPNNTIQQPLKWKTTIEAIDITTGEVLNTQTAKRKYLILKKTTTYKIKNHYGERQIKWHCKPNNQCEIF